MTRRGSDGKLTEMTLDVRARMSSPVTCGSPEATAAELIALLETRGCSAVPIVSSERLLGIVSLTDLLRESLREAGGEARRAADFMRRPVVTVRPDEGLDAAARRMRSARVHRLVVVEEAGDGERVVGVLSTRDVLGELARSRVPEASVALETLMTSPVETVDLSASVDEAVERLVEANVRGLVVVDVESPIGVFTQREALASRGLPASLRARPVEEVMSYETLCLDVATPLYRAAAHAATMNVRRLLVVERRRLVGIVSCLDLAGVMGALTSA